MKGSELLIDPDTGEVHTLPTAGAEEGEEQRLEASCIRLRLFCPNKFPGMSVGNVYLGFPALPYFLNVILCFEQCWGSATCWCGFGCKKSIYSDFFLNLPKGTSSSV
jgi:hypothetical protein